MQDKCGCNVVANDAVLLLGFKVCGKNTFLRGQDFCFYYMFEINCITNFWAQQNLGVQK